MGNGDEEFQFGAPKVDIVRALAEESENTEPDTALSNNWVPETAVSGAVGTVNVSEYKPVPTMIRRLVIYPFVQNAGLPAIQPEPVVEAT